MYPARTFIVGPYANSPEVSYTTTISYTTNTILPGLNKARQSLRGYCAPPPFWQDLSSTKVNQSLASGLLLLHPARGLIVGPYFDSPELSYTTSLSFTTDTILTGLVEESLMVIIYHCTLKNMKKVIDSSLYPKQSTVRGQSFFSSMLSGGLLSIDPHKKLRKKYFYKKNVQFWFKFWINDIM